MDVKALTRFARISPLKIMDLARAIQGMPVSDAVKALQFTRRKGAVLLLKTLKSAIANAEHNDELSADNLRVKMAVVEQGPVFKRFNAAARGRAAPITKRTSHLRIVLSDDKAAGKKK